MSPTASETLFHQGDALLIRPSNQDDPEALAHAGETCTFHRYGITNIFVVVRFEPGGKLYYFRKQDVVAAQREISKEKG